MSSSASGDVLALAIGTAGARIVSSLRKQKSTLVDRYAYLTCDQADLEEVKEGDRILIECPITQKLTPPIVRGLSVGYEGRIRGLFEKAKVVFIVAGLGRATGSGLAPLAAQMAREEGVESAAIAVMPFGFEEKLRFYAGLALRRLRANSSGVIVVDNEGLYQASDKVPLREMYEKANTEAVTALGSLLSRSSESSIAVGLNQILSAVSEKGYSVLSSSTSSSVDKTEEALSRAVLGISKRVETREVRRAVVVLTGGAGMKAAETATAVRRLGSMLGTDSVDIEYGVTYRGTGEQLQVSVLASGMGRTRYDEYDPLLAIETNIDDSPDYVLPVGLERLDSCE